ncbi:MAG TPA: methyltransferase domain-containing protein, partial [Anaerolineaceae bacterium]|nr:methyltransferase domain-containing protein [Anaerolineaceae bacterium]
MDDFSFPRYLAAKKSVDDRALNAQVWQGLKAALDELRGPQPVTILEIGAGTGTMLRRLYEGELLGRTDYLGIDADAGNVAAARQATRVWAEQAGLACEERGDCLRIQTPAGRIDAWFQQAELAAFLRTWSGRREWDLVMAHAFLDLVDVPASLPQLKRLACPGGWFSLTVNFDGLTALEPEIDPDLDARIAAAYHHTMDDRVVGGQRAGDSHTGRRLFGWLRAAGLEIVQAGGSDWVVFARDGQYPA